MKPNDRRSGRILGFAIAAALAACATSPPNYEIRLDANDTAEVSVEAPREAVYEAAIAEIRRRGAVEVSSLEGGWIVGEVGDAAVRIELASAAGDRTEVRVMPFVFKTEHRRAYSRVAEELPQFDLARRVAERVAP
jgi:hypothetical protein